MEIIAGETRILCDPWLTSGAFDGAWYHWPPLKTRPEDLTQYTHLYISHIHPDHCDLATLKKLPNKNAPVILLKASHNTFLRQRIASCGFSHFIELKDNEDTLIGPDTRIIMYGAFMANAFLDSSVPNVIDSSIAVQHESATIFNVNDNIPNVAICEKIRRDLGGIDIAFMPYSGLGPYPSSYDNLSAQEKIQEARRKRDQYLERFVENVRALNPRITIPCAGQAIIGGRHAMKTKVLGAASQQEALAALHRKKLNAALLHEGDSIETKNLVVERSGLSASALATPPDSYLASLMNEHYWWEKAFNVPSEYRAPLLPLLTLARKRLWDYQMKFHFFTDWNFIITIEDESETSYSFSFDSLTPVVQQSSRVALSVQKFLRVRIPYNYLIAILTRHGHWNNAYHGCLVDWLRSPDEYKPEIQMLLSYFHL